MKKQELFDTVLGTLAPKYGDVETELHFTTPFQLLVAVVLSAQCTDKRVNMITPALFEAYPDAATMAQATPEELLEYIKSVSYPNSKAKHLAGLAQMLVEAFNGEVPTTLEELTRLPGVGRKTANVVQAVASQSGISRRYARLPRQSSLRLSAEDGQYALQGGGGVKKIHSRRESSAQPLLVVASRALCLHGATPKVRQKRSARLMQRATAN